jgi:nickel-dependent lactate racemase
MTTLRIPYETIEKVGDFLEIDVLDKNLMFQSIPNEPEPLSDLQRAVECATEAPIESKRFSELIKSGKKVTFITENQFRAAPARDILPSLVGKAREAGCEITIAIGSGKVGLVTPEVIRQKLGDEVVNTGIPIVYNEFDKPDNYQYMGITSFGTPLFVHKAVAEADLVVTISTTQATLWGYGGSGMIVPAVSGDETIEINHVMSLAPDCIPGNNECRMQQDKYEALDIVGVDMGINVIVDNHGRITYLNAGSPVLSHKVAVKEYDRTYRFSIPALSHRKADIAITGTTTVTHNLYLHNSWASVNCDPAVRDGGVIIHASPSPGLAGKSGFAIMDVMKNYLPASEEKRIKAIKDFYEGKVREEQLWLGCVWYKIYEVMCKKEVWLVTAKDNLPVCEDIGIRAFDSIEGAYAEAMKRCGDDAKVAFIPYGRYTVVRAW